jgi:hypothetical protein
MVTTYSVVTPPALAGSDPAGGLRPTPPQHTGGGRGGGDDDGESLTGVVEPDDGESGGVGGELTSDIMRMYLFLLGLTDFIHGYIDFF